MTTAEGESTGIDAELKAIVDEMFDPSASGGLSRSVYLKMVEAVAFLMKHAKEIPPKLFSDYLFTVVKILDIKASCQCSVEEKAIPRKLISDMKVAFAPARSRRNLI